MANPTTISGNEIAELASVYLQGEPIEAPLLLINDCLLDLSTDLGVTDSQEIVAERGTWYDLSSDAIKVCLVEDSNEETYNDFEIRDDQIRFANSDTYSVKYTMLPTLLTRLTDTLAINLVWKHVIALYVAARTIDNREDGDQRKSSQLMEQYIFALGNAKNMLSSKKSTARKARVKPWR